MLKQINNIAYFKFVKWKSVLFLRSQAFFHQAFEKWICCWDTINRFSCAEIVLTLIHATSREQTINNSLSVHICKLHPVHIMDKGIFKLLIEFMYIAIRRFNQQCLQYPVPDIQSFSCKLNGKSGRVSNCLAVCCHKCAGPLFSPRPNITCIPGPFEFCQPLFKNTDLCKILHSRSAVNHSNLW